MLSHLLRTNRLLVSLGSRATRRRYATASSAILFVALLRARASLAEVLDEAAETVARDELLALELDARRGRGVVGLEPLLDGAALVRMAVYLLRICDGEGRCVLGRSQGVALKGRGYRIVHGREL